MSCQVAHMFYWYMNKVCQTWNTINTMRSCTSKQQSTQDVGSDLVRTARQWCHPRVGICCYMKNNMPWMCEVFHMFCGCMGNVWKTCDIINTLGPCSSKPQNTQAMGTYLVRTVKPPRNPQDWVGYVVKWRIRDHGCLDKHSMWCMDIWASYNRLERQYIHWDSINSSHRAPNLCYQNWWELQNNDDILRLVYAVVWINKAHRCVTTRSTWFWMHQQGLENLEHNLDTGILIIQAT